MARKGQRMSTVYVLRPVSGGPMKIGFTRGLVDARLAAAQAGSPVMLELLGSRAAPYWYELALHRMLAAHRLHGEWFDDCMEVRTLLEDFLAGVIPEGVFLDAMSPREQVA